MKTSRLRHLPSIGQLLEREDVRALVKAHSRSRVTAVLRDILEGVRKRFSEPGAPDDLPSPGDMAGLAGEKLRKSAGPGLCKAVNATGVILHTGLGRAVLCPSARKALFDLDGYSLVQMDVETGGRNVREAHVEKLITELTGAEAATVANNNAGATLLVLNTVAKGKEVIVSRGQLVEIGGSFRIPDVMKQSGARLVEVGTTNRTHLRDYENAVTEETAAFLHVHTSNYRVKGFTKSVPVADLVRLGKKHSLPVVDDLGSGALVDLARFGFGSEPLARDSVEWGADLVTFSADKLIGGPQGGVILGKKSTIEKVRKNPLMRALRVGKMTLTALEMTLREFVDNDRLTRNHPVMRMFSLSPAALRRRANRLAKILRKPPSGESIPSIEAEVEEGASRIGSGSLPLEDVPSWVVAVRSPFMESGKLAAALRRHDPPIFTRVHEEKVLFDLRTVLNSKEEKIIAKAVEKILLEAAP